MFRSYVNPTLEQVVNLVLTVPTAITEVHQCLGKCLAALITSIGPELQGKLPLPALIKWIVMTCEAFLHVGPLTTQQSFFYQALKSQSLLIDVVTKLLGNYMMQNVSGFCPSCHSDYQHNNL